MVQGRKLTNKKAAQSYGWINKDKVLLWQSAYVNAKRLSRKGNCHYIGQGPIGCRVFITIKRIRLYVYTSPEMEHKKTKVALNQLVYVFKKSPMVKPYW
jgi:hypothetical protein